MLKAALAPSGPAALAPLSPRTLPDQAADAIVHAIAGGVLLPGERIVEQKLAAALGISRVPVREGIRVLAAQGLVRVAPHRGCRVADFNAASLKQLKDVRVALEQVAARGACAAYQTDPDALRPLREAVTQMADIARRGDRLAMNQCDLQFHRALWVVAGNDMLMRLWEAISRHILVIFGLETETERDFEGIHMQHAHLLTILEAGDVEVLDGEIERHIQQLRYMYTNANNQTTKRRRK